MGNVLEGHKPTGDFDGAMGLEPSLRPRKCVGDVFAMLEGCEELSISVGFE